MAQLRDLEWHKKLDDAGSAHRHAMPRISSKIVLEVQAAAVACSALLPLAAEAWGVFDSDHPTNQRNQKSPKGVEGRLT